MPERKFCPRCGQEAKYTVTPYWDSPYKEHGLCSDCCVLAAKHYDMFGWPPRENPRALED